MRTVLHEHVEGTRLMVSYTTDPIVVVVSEAPPPYASAELAAAIFGSVAAPMTGHCDHCEALAPLARKDTVSVGERFPHAPWCSWSAEAITALHEACRPPGEPGEYSEAEAEAERERVTEYVHGLLLSLGTQIREGD